MRILAIESTCDETAAALVERTEKGVKVISNVVASSAEIHRLYGGVIPEVAAREQIKSIIPVIREALKTEAAEAVAVSYGPGLMGSLLIGVETAKALAWSWQVPLIKVNHMAAHLMANWIVENENSRVPELPAVGLVVSGGHTDLIWMKDFDSWEWIGGTRDDAAGEAFDKAARLLGLPYPGGPEVDKAAAAIDDAQFNAIKERLTLPRPLLYDPRMEMSFSGIKAAVARLVEKEKPLDETVIRAIAREFSEAVAEILVKKTLLAVQKYAPKSVILAGGVAANKRLRESLRKACEEVGVNFFVPELRYCGDNAAMVGAAAILKPHKADFDLTPDPGAAVV